MSKDTPYDPNLLARAVVGEPTPTMPFAPPRDAKQPFVVRDEATANWVVRKIAETRAHAERVRAYAERELKRAARKEEFFLKQYGPELEDWARQALAQQKGPLKRIRLPDGSVGYRAVGMRLRIIDDKALLNWCRTYLPSAIASSERVLKTPVDEYVTKTGELPPGAEIDPRGERFFIK